MLLIFELSKVNSTQQNRQLPWPPWWNRTCELDHTLFYSPHNPPRKTSAGYRNYRHIVMLLTKAQKRFARARGAGFGRRGGDSWSTHWLFNSKQQPAPKTTDGNVEQQVTMDFYHFWEISALVEAWESSMNKNNRTSFYLLYHPWRHLCKSWNCSWENRIGPYKHKYNSISTHHHLHPFL